MKRLLILIVFYFICKYGAGQTQQALQIFMRIITSTFLFTCYFLTFCCCGFSQIVVKQKLSPRELDSINAMELFGQRVLVNKIKLKSPGGRDGKPVNIPQPIASALANQSTGTIYCYDTSARFLIKTDGYTYYPYTTIRTKDNKLLSSGEYVHNSENQAGGFAMKTDEYGNIIWAKIFDSALGKPLGFLSYYQLLELKDGSVIMAGAIPEPQTQVYNVIFTRIDANGNILWSRTYQASVWRGTGHSSDNYFYLNQVAQDPQSGDIFFTGSHWGDGHSITRLSINDGSVVWSNIYQIGSFAAFDRPFGLDIIGNEIRSFSGFSSYNDIFLSIYRIDKNSGDTIEIKDFKLQDSSGFKAGILGRDRLKKLSNGHYVVSGAAFGYLQYIADSINPVYQASMAEFDEHLNFVSAYSFRNKIHGNAANVITAQPDGSGMVTMIDYVSSYTSWLYFIQFKNNQIVRRRKRYYTEGLPYISEVIRMNDGGDMSIRLVGDSASNVNKIEFIKLHISDTASDCLGINDYSTFMQPHKYVPYQFTLDRIDKNIFFDATPETLSSSEKTFDLLPGCQKIAYCDSLRLVPNRDSTCLERSVTIKASKNPACGAIPYFDYDTAAVKSFTQLTDSTFSLQFRQPWRGYIHASIKTCVSVEDSVQITVLASRNKLNLGPDTVICPGNTILLNAGTGFTSYRWQDGSIDSLFKVTTPGKYFLTVTNACGVIETDTVHVNAYAGDFFSVGPDISICKGDATLINATGGFAHYSWSPAYRINKDTGQSVIINPLTDTSYTIIAEQRPGCFAYDTLNVIVKQIEPVALGNDTSLCEGQSVTYDAGNGYESYQWSNGSAQQKITASTAGTYIAIVTKNGCIAKDTVKILSVVPLPLFSLGVDTSLCDKQTLSYNFNLNQAVYQWSDGSSSNSNMISKAGTWWLTVAQQGCSATDSIHISYKPLPAVNLGNDTTLCENSTLQLSAFNNNATYLWGDGSNAANYTISKAGNYSVTATVNGCSVSDAITVTYKSIPGFTLGPDQLVCKGQIIVLNPVVNPVANYVWQDGSTQSFFTVTTDGIYTLIASNDCGRLSDSVRISFALCSISMPSAFTPNKDGINDIFRVKYPFPVSKYNMAIYNRWGQKIFESSDITRGWDGTFKGLSLSMDTYIWIISLTDTEGKKQNAKGTVTLIR